MKLIPLGTSGAFPEQGRSAAGFLLRSQKADILMDCGNGTLSRLQKYADPRSLGGILLTHLHPDHTMDLYMLQVLMEFDNRGEPPIPLYGPEGTWERLLSYLPKEEGFRRAFDIRSYPDERFELSGMSIMAFGALHPGNSHSLRIEGEHTLFYTGDTGFSRSLAEAAYDARMLLAECTFLNEHGSVDYHLIPQEAGELAHAARADKLVLTHFWPGTDREKAKAEAAEFFSGEIIIAQEDEELEV